MPANKALVMRRSMMQKTSTLESCLCEDISVMFYPFTSLSSSNLWPVCQFLTHEGHQQKMMLQEERHLTPELDL